MAAELQTLVEELMKKMEEQRLQFSALEESQNLPGPSAPLAVATNSKFDSFNIPDPIKLIPTYAGEPSILSSWIESVDQKIEYCKKLINDKAIVDRVMPLWTGIIRDKIVKEGNDVLIRNQTENNWGAIKKALKDELGDKRDLATLSTKISQLKQGGQDLTSYHQQCKKLMADINAKLLANDDTKACVKILMLNYEAMITNAFIDGLPDYLSSLTRIYRPKNLQEAYEGALEQHLANMRRREKSKNQEQNRTQLIRPFPSSTSKNPGTYFGQNFQKFYPSQHQLNNGQDNRYTPHGQNFRKSVPPSNFRPQWQNPSTQNNPNPQSQNFRNPINQNIQSRFPALTNIKPDPSGQMRQSLQTQPYHRAVQVNTHESEEIPHCSSQNFPYYGMAYVNTCESEEQTYGGYTEEEPVKEREDCYNEETSEDHLNFHTLEGPSQPE